MSPRQETGTEVIKAERQRVKCLHLNKRYVINDIEFKIWRCVDCGLIKREME